ncbi:uncharacterized protein LOC106469528, partial [Limulus polyphemus]|uniref:Uncharacterized protein LOC106469528 n=1 Tax=Limulus polyphemus TaxID=6850 RepID=A0ABM1TD20_LIMPO
MLGVFRRHLKPKRSDGGRKDKTREDGCHESLTNHKETTSPPRAVRDACQVHRQEPDKVNVLGKERSILVTRQPDNSDLSDKESKQFNDSDTWELKNKQLHCDKITKDCIRELKETSARSFKGIEGQVKINKKPLVKDQADTRVEKDQHLQKFSSNILFDESSSENLKDQGESDCELYLNSFKHSRGINNVPEQNLNPGLLSSKKNVEEQLNDFSGYVNSIECDDGYWFAKSGEVYEKVNFAENFTDSHSDEQEPDGVQNLEMEREKTDPVKDLVERKITELHYLLEKERLKLTQEKRNVAQLKRQLNSWTFSQRIELKEELQKEKMHRLEVEACLKEVRVESQRCKIHLASLQEDFQQMEEMVKKMLQFQTRIDQLRHEKLSLALAYESKIRKYQTCLTSLERENLLLLNELCSLEASNKDHEHKGEQYLSRVVLERVRLLELENTALITGNEQQRLQYEHCLDDVANQVVQVLLAQKGLREECGKLQLKVQDLEQQNKSLSVLIKHHLLCPADFSSQINITPQLYGREALKRVWCSSSIFPDTDTVDMILSEKIQRPGGDSPTHTSHSEDSTDSLSSFCSDYSVNSGSSGRNIISHPGLPKMSSPLQWLINPPSITGYSSVPSTSRSNILTRSLLTNTPYGLNRSCMIKHLAYVAPYFSNPDCCSKDKVCTCALQAEKIELGESHKPKAQSVIKRIKNDLTSSRPLLHNCKSALEPTCYSQNSCRQSVDLSGLDTMKTPSEDLKTLENLPYTTSFQRLLFSKENSMQQIPQTNQSVQTKITQNTACICKSPVTRHSAFLPQELQFAFSAIPTRELASTHSDICKSEHSIPRPTSLNVVHCETLHSVSFPALEQKRHDTCENVYEEVDLPHFPTENTSPLRIPESPKYSASPNKNNLLENWFINESSPKLSSLGEEFTNTVIRRGHGTTEITECCAKYEVSKNVGFSSETAEVQFQSKQLPASPPLQSLEECLETGKVLNENVCTYHSEKIQKQDKTIQSSEGQASRLSGTVPKNGGPISAEGPEHGSKDEGNFTLPSHVQMDTNITTNSTDVNKDSKLTVEPVLPKYLISAADLDSIVVSSTDSGFELLRDPQDQRQLSQNADDRFMGFEQELDSSVSQNVPSVPLLDKEPSVRVSPTLNDAIEKEQSDSNLMDLLYINKCSPFNHQEKNNLPQSNLSNLEPSNDKILSLLTPQGYKTERNNMRRIALPTLQLPSACQVKTAEKSTSTDLQYLGLDFHFSDSSLSVSSSGSTPRSKAFKELVLNRVKQQVHKETQVELDRDSTLNFSNGSTNSYRNKMEATNISKVEDEHLHKKCVNYNTYQDVTLDSFLKYSICSSDQNCIRHECHQSLLWPINPTMLNTFSIRRVVSDSFLYINEKTDCIFHDYMKLAFPSGEHGQERLNLQPLERHSSAKNLFYPPPSVTLKFLPGLQRSHCRVLVKQRQSRVNHNLSWKDSMKAYCNLSDEDENDLMEHQSFVQQWLHQNNSQWHETFQNVYDEEEIGNWTFQLSLEDVSQPAGSSYDTWESTPNDQEPCSQIHEITAEDEYHEDLCNQALWTSGIVQETTTDSLAVLNKEKYPKLFNNQKHVVSNGSFCENEHVEISQGNVKDNINVNFEECEVLFDKSKNKEMNFLELFPNFSVSDPQTVFNYSDNFQNQQENKGERLSETDNCLDDKELQDKETSTNVSEEDKIIKTGTTEFYRNFYRLYPLGSTKSLNDSLKILPKYKPVGSSEQEKKALNHILLLQVQFIPKSLSKPELAKLSRQQNEYLTNLFLLQKQSFKDVNDYLKKLSDNESKDFSKQESKYLNNTLISQKLVIKALHNSSNNFLKDEPKNLSFPTEENTSLTDLSLMKTLVIRDQNNTLNGSAGVESKENSLWLRNKSLTDLSLVKKQTIIDLRDSPNSLKSEPINYSEQEDKPSTNQALLLEHCTNDINYFPKSIPVVDSFTCLEQEDRSWKNLSSLQKQSSEDFDDFPNSLVETEQINSSGQYNNSVRYFHLPKKQFLKCQTGKLDNFQKDEYISASVLELSMISTSLSKKSEGENSHEFSENLPKSELCNIPKLQGNSLSLLQEYSIKHFDDSVDNLLKSKSMNSSVKEGDIITSPSLTHELSTDNLDGSSESLLKVELVNTSEQEDRFKTNSLLAQEQSTKRLGSFSKSLLESVSPSCLEQKDKLTHASLLSQEQTLFENLDRQPQNIENLCIIIETHNLHELDEFKHFLSNLDKSDLKGSDTVAVEKVISHSNESDMGYHKDLNLHQDKRKNYAGERLNKHVCMDSQKGKVSRCFSLKIQKPQECIHAKGNVMQDVSVVSKKLHKIPARKSRNKDASRNLDLQSPVSSSSKEKIHRLEKTKMSHVAKSPTCDINLKDLSSCSASSSKQDLDKKHLARGRQSSVKKSQSSHRALKQIRQPHQRLNGNGRKGNSSDARRSPHKSDFSRRELTSKGKEITVYVKKKNKSETNKIKEVQVKQLQIKQASFPEEEREKKNNDLLKNSPVVTYTCSCNLVDVTMDRSNLSVAEKIQHLNSLLEQGEKEKVSAIPSLKHCDAQRQKSVCEQLTVEPSVDKSLRQEEKHVQVSGNKEGCDTSWIHVEADVDLSDPKARANLLDSMIESSSNSSEEENGDEVQEHQHNQRLHALHRFRRQKKR